MRSKPQNTAPGSRGFSLRDPGICTAYLNGIDIDRWDPRRDPFLPEPYDEGTPGEEGRGEACAHRARRVRRRHLERLPRPLIGIVSRLIDQKGFDLIAELVGVLPGFGSFAVARHRRSPLREDVARSGRRVSRPVRRQDRVRRIAGAPHRRRGGYVSDAVPFRAMWAEPDVQHAVRDSTAGSGNRAAWRTPSRITMTPAKGALVSSSGSTPQRRCRRRWSGREAFLVTRISGTNCRSRACARIFPGTDRPASTSNYMRSALKGRA